MSLTVRKRMRLPGRIIDSFCQRLLRIRLLLPVSVFVIDHLQNSVIKTSVAGNLPTVGKGEGGNFLETLENYGTLSSIPTLQLRGIVSA